jgi:signal transduction histidine kinase
VSTPFPPASAELGWETWSRLIQDAASNPDPAEALSSLVQEAVTYAGARAGVVVQPPDATVRSVWGCEAADARAVLGGDGPVRAAISRAYLPDDAAVWMRGRELAGTALAGCERLLIAPLHLRETATGVLILFFEEIPRRPRQELEPTVAAIGRLVALVLENERLAEDARLARQLRDDFLTAINHELRTPATAFVLDAFMVRSGMYGVLPPSLDKHLQQIESHLEIITRVLDGVLSLGHEPGTATGYGDVFQPRQVVLNLLRRIEPAAKRKNLPILFFAPRTLPMLQLDVAPFSRVLLHLLSNAVKYTAEGRIEVRLQLGFRPLGRQKRERVLVIRVVDTGCGIPQEHLARIFEPFAQVEEGSRTDSRTRGLGLGLSIARKLARSIRGEVEIESTVGQGTTVSFTVPYHH